MLQKGGEQRRLLDRHRLQQRVALAGGEADLHLGAGSTAVLRRDQGIAPHGVVKDLQRGQVLRQRPLPDLHILEGRIGGLPAGRESVDALKCGDHGCLAAPAAAGLGDCANRVVGQQKPGEGLAIGEQLQAAVVPPIGGVGTPSSALICSVTAALLAGGSALIGLFTGSRQMIRPRSP